jgi:dihydrolipoamide dehydrogenase
MVVGNAPEATDLVVIGAGPGGYTAALHAAKRGRDVILIDRSGDQQIGGVCLHAGCIPSKSLIEASALFERSQNSQSMGVSVTGAAFDMTQFQQYKASVIDKLANGVKSKLKQAGVSIIAGNAMFTNDKTVVVATDEGQARFLQFRDCVIATGSRPVAIPDFEFGDTVLDAKAALDLAVTPKSIAVIGAGYIGLELGCAFAKLGSKVTVIEAEANLLPTMPSAGPGPVLQRSMEKLGVSFYTRSKAESYAKNTLRFVDAEGEPRSIKADYVLSAVGRKPNTDHLELDSAGINVSASGHIPVNADCRVSPHIAAIGDIVDGPALAHKASAEAIVAVDALCGDSTAFEPQAIPLIVFTDPEIAIAGVSLEQARHNGINAVAQRLPMKASGRATTMNHTEGYIELISDSDDGALLGATIVAAHASELIAEVCVAIEMGAGIEDLALTIHPHPTLSELLMDVAASAK